MSSSRGSSQSRDWTQVSCIAGKFFTVWATREARHLSNLVQISIKTFCRPQDSNCNQSHCSFHKKTSPPYSEWLQSWRWRWSSDLICCDIPVNWWRVPGVWYWKGFWGSIWAWWEWDHDWFVRSAWGMEWGSYPGVCNMCDILGLKVTLRGPVLLKRIHFPIGHKCWFILCTFLLQTKNCCCYPRTI